MKNIFNSMSGAKLSKNIKNLTLKMTSDTLMKFSGKAKKILSPIPMKITSLYIGQLSKKIASPKIRKTESFITLLTSINFEKEIEKKRKKQTNY